MSSRRRVLFFALATVLLLPAAAVQAGKETQGPGQKPSRPGKLQVMMPRILKPAAKVLTYLKQVRTPQQQHRIDPLGIELEGYNRGTQVELLQQGESAPIGLPTRRAVQDLRRQAKQGKKVKQLTESQAIGRLLGREVAKAQSYTPVATIAIQNDSPNQPTNVELQQTLKVGTPLLVRARDLFGRQYRRVFTNAGELMDQWRAENGNNVLRQSIQVPTYQPWMTAGNLLVSAPQLGDRPVQGQGQQVQGAGGLGTVTLVGLTAFPRGAKVTAKNLTQSGETVTFIAGQPGQGKNRRAGGDRFQLQGEAGDRIQVEVTVPRTDGGAASSVAYYIEVPRAGGTPVVSKRGREYHLATLQPAEVTLDPAKFMVSPAYASNGKGQGMVQLRWEEGAISRGAVVKVTNRRLAAENQPASQTIFTSKQNGFLSVPGAMTDRLQVEVSYPGGGSQTFVTEVPMHKGKPVLRDGGQLFYQAQKL